MLELNSLNASEKALLITFSLLKSLLNGSEISISSTLKILLCTLVLIMRPKIKVDKQIIVQDKILKFFF